MLRDKPCFKGVVICMQSNKVIKELLAIGGRQSNADQIMIDGESSDRIIKVSLSQFYEYFFSIFSANIIILFL